LGIDLREKHFLNLVIEFTCFHLAMSPCTWG
jgi:hypothetical protein